jgi:hypothetical protein
VRKGVEDGRVGDAHRAGGLLGLVHCIFCGRSSGWGMSHAALGNHW